MRTIQFMPSASPAEIAGEIKAEVNEHGAIQCMWRGERLEFDWIATLDEITDVLVDVERRRPAIHG